MIEGKVKGALLIDYVRIIRANKDMPWDEYLKEGDMTLVNGQVIPSTWYPLDAFERIGYAIFMLLGKGDLKVAKAFGALTMQETFHKIYQNVIFKDQDPVSVLNKFVVLRKQFIKFSDPELESLKLEKLDDNKVRLILKAPEPSKYIEPYAHQITGGFEKLMDMIGIKDAKVSIIKIQSETEPASEIEVTWGRPGG